MNDIEKAREILKDDATGMSDEQINTLLAFVDYMCEGWLDKFEVSTFGKTADELTNPNH